MPSIFLQITADQAIPTSAVTAITWPAPTTHGPAPVQPLWVAANPTRLYADRDGWWLLTASAQYAVATGGGDRDLGAMNSSGGYLDAAQNTPIAAGHYGRADVLAPRTPTPPSP